MEGVSKAVEGQCPGERNDMPTVDEPALVAALFGDELVKMNARRVLVEPRGDLMLGFLNGHTLEMVDPFSRLVVVKEVPTTSELEVVGRQIDHRAGRPQRVGRDRLRQRGNQLCGRWRGALAFSHHDPADELQCFGAVLSKTGGAD